MKHFDARMVPAGHYHLTAPVQNPAYDKRVRNDLRAVQVIPVGSRVRIQHFDHCASEVEVTTPDGIEGTIDWYTGAKGDSLDGPVLAQVCAHLAPFSDASTTLDDTLDRSTGGKPRWGAHAYHDLLVDLIKGGFLSIEGVRRVIAATHAEAQARLAIHEANTDVTEIHAADTEESS